MSSEEKVPVFFEVQTVRNEPNAPKSCQTTFMAIGGDRLLDFATFKRYVLQQAGISGNVPVKYVDEDNDQIPIESEEEFKEAIKIARDRSSKGAVLMLIVDISKDVSFEPDSSTNANEETEKIKTANPMKAKSSMKRKQDEKTGSKSFLRFPSSHDKSRCSLSKLCASETVRSAYNPHMHRSGLRSTPGVQRAKLLQNVLAKMTSSEQGNFECQEIPQRAGEQNVEQPPAWFISYMEKFKADILLTVREMIQNKREHLPTRKEMKSKQHTVKRQSEDESSDNQQCGSEPRSCKILRKLEKLQKREKKLEHKLDQRLEKMESKKKRMLEKVSQTKTFKRKTYEGSGPVPYLMGGCSVKPLSPIHVAPGQMFSRTWEVLNDGTLPWTDATEMRQAWGSAGLEPVTTVVKCPPLAPGEQGHITVVFSAPGTYGTYHSYWHLFHMGERFGHWIVCTVIVDPIDTEEAVVVAFTESMANNSQEVEKELVEKLNAVSLTRNPEYDSGSDLEVCSNVSDSDSVDSFVVVDLPMSLFSDSPSESKGTIPVKVRSKNCIIYSKSDKKKNAKSNFVKNDSKSDGELIKSPSEISIHLASPSESPPNESEAAASYEPVKGNVYMVDRAGNCIVAPATQSAELYPTLEPIYTAAFPVYTQTMQPVVDPAQNFYCYSALMDHNYAPQTVVYPTMSGPTVSTQTQQINTPPTDFGRVILSETNEAIESKIQEHRGKGAEKSKQAPVEVAQESPETLVSGVINVASKAYNTAQSVLNNLRTTKQGEASEFDPVFESNLSTLYEMGFTNTARNVEVLKSVGNNIAIAIPILLSQSGQQ